MVLKWLNKLVVLQKIINCFQHLQNFNPSLVLRNLDKWSILAFFLMIAYWPNVEGAATTLRWCLLYAFVPLLVHFRCNLNFHHLFIALSFGIGINSVYVLFQWFGYRPVIQIFNSPPGLFINGNILAETTALVIVGCIIYRLYYLLLLLAPSMLLPMQRGSMIALVIVGMIYIIQFRCVLLQNTFRVKFLIPILLFLVLGVFLSLIGYLTFQRLNSLQERLELWTFTITHLTWLGNGFDSFRINYLNVSNLLDNSYYIIHAHNDILELIYSYGIFAIIPIGAIGLSLWTSNPLRYVVATFIIEGLFEFPLFMPTTLFIASLCWWYCLFDRDGGCFIVWWRRIYSYTRNGQTKFRECKISV